MRVITTTLRNSRVVIVVIVASGGPDRARKRETEASFGFLVDFLVVLREQE